MSTAAKALASFGIIFTQGYSCTEVTIGFHVFNKLVNFAPLRAVTVASVKIELKMDCFTFRIGFLSLRSYFDFAERTFLAHFITVAPVVYCQTIHNYCFKMIMLAQEVMDDFNRNFEFAQFVSKSKVIFLKASFEHLKPEMIAFSK
jgi:hypothetical protein